MKNKINSLIVEGIIFCGSGLALLSYSLISYANAFNKAWGQSPYLFPMIVAVAMIGLSLWLIGEGILEMKKRAAGTGEPAKKRFTAEQTKWVVIALVICVLYYLALAYIKFPYVTIGILTFEYTFSTFEIVTVVFLVAMMVFMGVRKPKILVFVPLGTTLFLSIAFRTLLHVLLP
jgi:hypothetical protein